MVGILLFVDSFIWVKEHSEVCCQCPYALIQSSNAALIRMSDLFV